MDVNFVVTTWPTSYTEHFKYFNPTRDTKSKLG